MKRILPFAILAVLPFLFSWKLFRFDPQERLIYRGDFLTQHYVWKSYALGRIERGELPLWNPHLMAGVPFHANPQVGIFYPPTYLLLPFYDEGDGTGTVDYMALEAYQLLHQVFAGIGMFLLLRSFGIGMTGGLVAAIAFMFTGFFTTPGHQAIVLTASWLPWVLLAIRRAAPPVVALVLALMVLAGHPQVAYYALLLALAFALVTHGMKNALRRFAPALLLGLGLAAIQLGPTYELASDSIRSELGYDYSTSFAFSPYFLAATVAPRGQVRLPNQDGSAPLHIYAGVAVLLLAAIGLLIAKDKSRLFFAAAAAVALLTSFGEDSPLFDLFYVALPGFDRFRVPYRLLGIYAFSMAALAGIGMDVLARAGRKERLRLRSVVKGAFIVLMILVLWASYVHTRLLSDPGALSPDDVERVVGAAHWATLLGASSFLLLLVILWRPAEHWARVAFVLLVVVDMGAFVKDRAQHPYETLVRAGARPIDRIAEVQEERGRYVTDSNLETYAMLHGTEFAGGHEALADARYHELLDLGSRSANALAIMNVRFVVRPGPARHFPWCGARYQSPLPILDVPSELSPAQFALEPRVEATRIVFYWSPLRDSGTASIELDGVEAAYPLVPGEPLEIELDEPTTLSHFRIVVPASNPGIRLEDIEVDLNPLGLKVDFLELEGIYINLHALPRAYFVVPTSVPSEIQTLDTLACWTVHGSIQVSSDASGGGSAGFFRRGAASITSYAPESIEIATRSPRAGYLVLSDTFRPGWKATVDGGETEILRAQHAFRAVAVPEGEHVVRFLYDPRSFRIGARVSLASLAAVALWAALLAFQRRRKPDRAPVSPGPEGEDHPTEPHAP